MNSDILLGNSHGVQKKIRRSRLRFVSENSLPKSAPRILPTIHPTQPIFSWAGRLKMEVRWKKHQAT